MNFEVRKIHNPYTDLAEAIVRMAVEDYKTYYLHYIDTRTSPTGYGKSAKRFLESKRANIYLGIGIDLNIREIIDEQVGFQMDIDELYEKERRKHDLKRVCRIT